MAIINFAIFFNLFDEYIRYKIPRKYKKYVDSHIPIFQGIWLIDVNEAVEELVVEFCAVVKDEDPDDGDGSETV